MQAKSKLASKGQGSNQPQAPKAIEGSTLLQRLRVRHHVELGMEIQGFNSRYLLEGTSDKKILISSNDDFLGSAITIDDALKIIGDTERRKPSEYDKSTIKTTYVYQVEEPETKFREELMPSKATKANSIKHDGITFYIIKKRPNGKASNLFHLYNWKTRNFIWLHHDRDMVIGFIYRLYPRIKHKDI